MCCDLRTHVKVIAIICMIFTGLGFVQLIGIIGIFIIGPVPPEVNMNYFSLAFSVQMLVFIFRGVSEIMCLVGAIKNNKCLLIPFIICSSLTVLACIGFLILILSKSQAVIVLAYSPLGFGISDNDFEKVGETSVSVLNFLVSVPFLITMGLTIYFLVIVLEHYKDLSSGTVSWQQEGMVITPNTNLPIEKMTDLEQKHQ